MRYSKIAWQLPAALCLSVATVSTVWSQSSAAISAASDTYARYSRPGECSEAASRLTSRYWRDKRADTVVYAPTTDSVPASALQAARACASRFTVAGTPQRDLLSLVQLYLWTQQDTLANSAAKRFIAVNSKKGEVERGWILYQLALSYLKATPVRIGTAKSYLARLDSMGTSIAAWRMLAHTEFSKYAMSVDDVPGALAEGKAAIAASEQMEKNDRIDRVFATSFAYYVLAEPTSIIEGGPAAVALFDTAMAKLLPLAEPKATAAGDAESSGATEMIIQQGGAQGMPGVRMVRNMAGPSARMMLQQQLTDMQRPYTIVGKAAPPVKASHWYNASGDTVKLPAPGTVTLLVSVTANCGAFCYKMYSSIRRLYDAHHAAGLQLVLMSSTSGFFRNQPAPVPSGEAEKIRGYFVDFLKLPGVFGVNETEFSHIMDGRRMNVPGQSQRDYFRGSNFVVVGKDGKVAMVGNLSPEREKAASSVIAKALAK